jgi:uncharacterized protein (DUF2236 family)
MITPASENNARLFDFDSKIWQVNREMVLLLAGGRALLMQLAHPKVAAGVADHSRFQEDPFGRLYRTMSTMWSIVFDVRSEADAALERVEQVHSKVRGLVPEHESYFTGGNYDALDQDLLLWVHATLIDSAMVAYGQFVLPMDERERITYYDDSKKLARLFGVQQTILPSRLADFERYVRGMLGSDRIVVGPTAKRLAQDVLYARPWIFKSAGPLFRFMTAGLLPEKLRSDYGLSWSGRKAKLFAAAAAVVRAVRPLIPAPLRIVPNARRAEKVKPGPKR